MPIAQRARLLKTKRNSRQQTNTASTPITTPRQQTEAEWREERRISESMFEGELWEYQDDDDNEEDY